jgi:hypothetical protein
VTERATAWLRAFVRTEEQRKQYREEQPGDFMPLAIDLIQEDVVEAMDKLASAVKEIDPTVYRYTWGRVPVPNLTP